MQSPTVIEAGDEVLQVLEVCEPVEEIKEVIVTTRGEDSNPLPEASCGPAAKPSQVRQRLANMLTAASVTVLVYMLHLVPLCVYH